MRKIAAALLLATLAASASLAQGDEKQIKERQTALAGALKAAKTPEEAGGVATDFLTLADEAMAADCYDGALKAAEQAAKIGASTKNAALTARAQARLLEIKDAQAEYKKAQPFFKTLETKPDDGEAHLAVGKFLAYHKNDWSAALEHFRKCSDPAFKAASGREPKDAPAQMSLGDEWWALGESKKGLERDRLRLHALEPYRIVWPDLDGEPKERVRTRAMLAQSRTAERKTQGDLPAPFWTSTKQLVWLDEKFAHSGKTSVYVGGVTKDVREGWTGVNSAQIVSEAGRRLTVSVWALCDANKKGDVILVRFYNANGECFGQTGAAAPIDVPFWSRIETTVTCPPKTAKVDISFQRGSSGGAVWLDDLSMKNPDGTNTELVENGGFERR